MGPVSLYVILATHCSVSGDSGGYDLWVRCVIIVQAYH